MQTVPGRARKSVRESVTKMYQGQSVTKMYQGHAKQMLTVSLIHEN